MFQEELANLTSYISETEYRHIISDFLKRVYPELASVEVLHLYAPIREISHGEALLHASGDFYASRSGGGYGQKAFEGLFLALNLAKKSVRKLDNQDGLKSWYRGNPDRNATYGSGFFVSNRPNLDRLLFESTAPGSQAYAESRIEFPLRRDTTRRK